MSQRNVEIVQSAYEYVQATGRVHAQLVAADFVWDMSKFTGWPERQLYEGIVGAQSFIDDWSAAWDGWQMTFEAFYDAGAQIVAVVRQHGRAKATGMTVDMLFAQVWTIRDGMLTRMEMYADPVAALHAVGLDA